jgi:hypothetical protein
MFKGYSTIMATSGVNSTNVGTWESNARPKINARMLNVNEVV